MDINTSMRMRVIGRWLLTLWLLAMLPARAVAQAQPDLERAKESFNAGATAYAAGDYLAAIQAFDAAYALTPRPAITFSLAQAERRQYFASHEPEHLDRAVVLYRRYVDEVPVGGRRADALDALSQLEPLAALHATAAAPAGPATGTGALVRQTRVMITSEAPGAAISLDGALPMPSPLIREVEPGRHRVGVKAPGFFPAEREVAAVAGELIPLAVGLREEPSTVVVTVPAEAELYVDGAFVNRTGADVILALPSGSHRLVAAGKGHRVSSRTLDLERGKTRTVHFTLEPTRQRRASYWLMAGAGGALGAGVVLTALALHAENRAQSFLDRQSRGNVSSGDLADYRAAVSDRDRYRVADAISLVAGALLAATAVGLYQLDDPDHRELSRSTSAPVDESVGTPPSPTLARLHIAPVATGGLLGAMFSGAF